MHTEKIQLLDSEYSLETGKWAKTSKWFDCSQVEEYRTHVQRNVDKRHQKRS